MLEDYTATVTQPDLAKAPKTAEWIVEAGESAMQGGAFAQTQTNFGEVNFESMFFNDRPVTADDTLRRVAVGSSGDRPKADISELSQFGGHGPNFTVTWLRP